MKAVNSLDYAAPLPKKRFGRGIFGWVLFSALVVMLCSLMQMKNAAYNPIPVSTFLAQVRGANVATIWLEEKEASGKFIRPVVLSPAGMASAVSVTSFRCELPAGLTGQWGFIDLLTTNGADVQIEAPNPLLSLLVPIIPWLLIVGLIWFVVLQPLRNRRAHVIAPIPPIGQAAPSEQS